MDQVNRTRRTRQWILLLIVAALIVAGGAIGILQNGEADEPGGSKLALNAPVEPVMNAQAPDFTLQTAAGDTVQLSDFLGQPVLINFWATWCGPCRIEMPVIQERFERDKEEGLVVLAVNFDESLEEVAAYGEELGLTFHLVLDPGGEIQTRYRNRSYPTTFFVDAQGIIRAHHIGVMTEKQLDENLVKINIGQ